MEQRKGFDGNVIGSPNLGVDVLIQAIRNIRNKITPGVLQTTDHIILEVSYVVKYRNL